MSRILLPLLITASLIWTSCNSQSESDPIAEDGQSLLWKIEGNGLEEASYLYGTIHLISQKDFLFTKRIRKAIAKSEVMVFEIDMNMEAMMAASLGSMFSGDTTIADYLSEAQYDSLQSFLLDSLGVSSLEWASYKRMKPLFLSTVFYTKTLDGMPVSFEIEFKSVADSLEIPVLGLETVEEQLAFANSISMEDQVSMLMNSVRNHEEETEMMADLTRFYKEGMIDSIMVVMEEVPEYGAIEENLLVNRNKNWIAGIDSIIKGQRAFIAVGAGHLPGERGVIKLLEQEGYTLTPIETR